MTNGVVALTGSVRSEKLKSQTEKVVKKVKGVKDVENKLRVNADPPSSDPRSNHFIELLVLNDLLGVFKSSYEFLFATLGDLIIPDLGSNRHK